MGIVAANEDDLLYISAQCICNVLFSPILQVFRVAAGGSWQAFVMEHLPPSRGWAPLSYYAQASANRLCQQHMDPTSIAARLPCPTPEEWQQIQQATEVALARGHAARIDDQPVAHGDVRLNNVLGKQRDDQSWAICFVDFDWSGVEDQARLVVNERVVISRKECSLHSFSCLMPPYAKHGLPCCLLHDCDVASKKVWLSSKYCMGSTSGSMRDVYCSQLYIWLIPANAQP